MSNTKHNLHIPTTLVVFGATGDLMAKKIVPALYHLYETGQLSKLFRVIGFARRPLTDTDFQDRVREILTQHHIPHDTDAARGFVSLFSYHQGNFETEADYHTLAQSLGHIDGEWKACSNKLLYLAVPPQYYQDILGHLKTSGLNVPCGGENDGWTRIVVEKPFGSNLETARRLDDQLAQIFHEDQIFRIDHYLAKEMLQNVLAFRFANNLFETTWGNELIERIDIQFWETLGVEERGAFYDSVGALRDFGQNHHLQALALLTMDHPRNFSAEAVRQKRAEILGQLRILSNEEITGQTYRAQYAGYPAIVGVQPDSQTETFFRIEAALDSPRWRGVPIRLEGGKRLAQQRKEAIVTLRHPKPCLCPPGHHYENKVVLTLEPEERITIHFWSKKPGLSMEMEPRTFDFLYREPGTRRQYVEEYIKLLLDCTRGDQLLFVSTDEIHAMWRFVDPIEEAWAANTVALHHYEPDTYPVVPEFDPASASGMPPELAIVGLGKMGGNLARNLLDKDWRVVGWNRTQAVAAQLASDGLVPVHDFAELATSLRATPRVVWVMLPAGEATDEAIFGADGLVRHLKPGDIIIDGGNSYFKDTLRRGEKLQKLGFRFLDVGTSGGPGGARAGACLMIGGAREDFTYLEPLFRAVSLKNGYQFFDGHGAGHFVKMVHNGIEYGIMQAIAEGFEIMQASDYQLDLTRVADIYNHGSVIESRLIGWMHSAFVAHGEDLTDVTSTVAHTGEGAWTIETAKELGIEAKIIEGALDFRKQSAANPRYAGKVLSALREQFGGHSIK